MSAEHLAPTDARVRAEKTYCSAVEQSPTKDANTLNPIRWRSHAWAVSHVPSTHGQKSVPKTLDHTANRDTTPCVYFVVPHTRAEKEG